MKKFLAAIFVSLFVTSAYAQMSKATKIYDSISKAALLEEVNKDVQINAKYIHAHAALSRTEEVAENLKNNIDVPLRTICWAFELTEKNIIDIRSQNSKLAESVNNLTHSYFSNDLAMNEQGQLLNEKLLDADRRLMYAQRASGGYNGNPLLAKDCYSGKVDKEIYKKQILLIAENYDYMNLYRLREESKKFHENFDSKLSYYLENELSSARDCSDPVSSAERGNIKNNTSSDFQKIINKASKQ